MLVGKDDQPGPVLGHCLDEVEGVVGMAGRQDATKMAVSVWRFCEQDSTMCLVSQFGAEDRFDAGCAGHLEEPDGAVQAVGIGEREGISALRARRLTEGFERWNTLHRRIGGMDV